MKKFLKENWFKVGVLMLIAWGIFVFLGNANVPTTSSSDSAGSYITTEIDRDCSDFATHAQAQAFFESEGGPLNDYHGLDKNKDGIACESLP